MTQATHWQDKHFAWPAPAKLNLFLHITGRRDDGYHLLQTVFQFVDFGDELYFEPRNDEKVVLQTSLDDVAHEDNIVVKAAKTLQAYSSETLGVDIKLTKRIPMGGGLGGGSSDAATTLLALNKLWQINLTKSELMDIGLKLGADVPVFIYGHAAWAEGVGEQLQAVSPPENWYLIIYPAININTGAIFSSSELTRDKLPIKIRDFLSGPTENVCEPVVSKLYPEVKVALNWLNQFAKARLTGTGACLFASFESEAEANNVASQVPEKWHKYVAKGSNKTQIEKFYWGVAKR